MTINDEITILANQIANKGKKPTVASIKTKLKTKVPLPVIISVLKTWQHEPGFTTLPTEKTIVLDKENNSSSINEESFERILHDELAGIKEEIHELKIQVQALINQQKK